MKRQFIIFFYTNPHSIKRKVAITTDLDKKYHRIIEKLGFKHQLCIFHTLKSLNKLLKNYLKQKTTTLKKNLKNHGIN